MAAEALAEAGKAMGHQIRVETRGSVGAQNQLTDEEIAAADVVVLACDIEVDPSRFAGKRIYRTSTSNALKKPCPTLEAALTDAAVEDGTSAAGGASAKKGIKEKGVYKHLLTGVSFMLPMVVAGGLLIALSFVFGIEAFQEEGTLAAALMQIGGGTAFALMIPVLAGYIAYSIADRPGIAPGMIGGMLAANIDAGFIGGILAGFLAGYVALAVTRYVKLPASVESLKPILIIPFVASLVTGLTMIYVIGEPVAAIMAALTGFLSSMGSTNAVLLGILLGAMMCFDLVGPSTKPPTPSAWACWHRKPTRPWRPSWQQAWCLPLAWASPALWRATSSLPLSGKRARHRSCWACASSAKARFPLPRKTRCG